MVQPQRTSSNLFVPLECRESKVCIGLSHEFGVVRLYQTFSNHIFTRGSRCVGYLYTTSGRLNCSELSRTFSNHFSAEKAMYVQVSYMSLGWFDYTSLLSSPSSLSLFPLSLFSPSEPAPCYHTVRQYCVYRDGNGWFCIIAIHKEISIFAFNFNSICLLRTSRWRTCEKVTACKIMDENITGGVKYS